MRKRPPNFGERVTNLRIAYGSQKALAKSFGVSVRTIQRWEKRKDAPQGTTRFEPQKIRRRERYIKERARKAEPTVSVRRAVTTHLNDLIRGDIAAAEFPGWLREHQPRALNSILGSGGQFSVDITTIGKEVWIVGIDDPLDILEDDESKTETYTFDAPEDYIEFEAIFWDVFRRAYK